MKLEEFFTPFEMKDGLASVSRVEKLVTMMQQDKFHTANNIAEAICHCSTIAIVLSATQNTDCLQQFIQLGGLHYLDKLFQEVLKYNDKSGDQVITAVLEALKKLPMDLEGLRSCGIGNALEHLHCHENLEIQGRARNLSDGWQKIINVNLELPENAHESRCMGKRSQGMNGDANSDKVSVPGEDSAKGEAGSCKWQTTSSSEGTSETFPSWDIAIACSVIPVSGSISAKEFTGNGTNPDVLKHSLETINFTTSISSVNGTDLDPDQAFEHVEVKELDTGNRTNVEANDAEDDSLCAVAADFDEKQKHLPMNFPLEMVDDGSSNYWKKTMEQKPENEAMKNKTITLPGKQNSLDKTKHDFDAFRKDDSGKELYTHIKSGPGTIRGKIAASNLRSYQKNAEEMIRKKPEVDLAYEEDALEVARQVAKEVEKEIGIYEEASCSSSSMKDTDCEAVEIATADSIVIGKNESSTEHRDKSESCVDDDIPDSCCSTKEELDLQTSGGNDDVCEDVKDMSQETCATTLGKDERLIEQDMSQLTAAPHEPADSERTYPCTFDLNEDAQTEEIECPGQSVAINVSPNLSAPIPVVATSRGMIGFPVAPLLFEGELGWRGSAATSAFRPALTCRTLDKYKVCSTEENKCKSKNLQCFRDIDLNVADTSDDAAMDLFLGKLVPVFSSLASGESSVEVSSKKVERLNLDLNRLGDSDNNCQDLFSDQCHRNETCSSSLSSSSRPSMRDFDLNDNPSIGEAHVFDRPAQGSIPSRSWRLDDPAVSILGTRLQPEPDIHPDLGLIQDFGHSHGRKEFPNHHPQSFLMSAPSVVPPIGQMGRAIHVQPTLGYAAPPAFPYSSLGLGTIPLPSTVYSSGAVSYMVDTRGFPQILGSSGAHLPFPRSPYLMGVAGAPGTNDIGILRSNLDLNAGWTSLDADAREGGHMRHMFFAANNTLLEEQMKSFQQVSMSGQSLKRKEPDCRWDPYQIGYKQATSRH